MLPCESFRREGALMLEPTAESSSDNKLDMFAKKCHP